MQYKRKVLYLQSKKYSMYYIWFDESDKEGALYSNFYGGILVDSKNYEKVTAMSYTLLRSV